MLNKKMGTVYIYRWFDARGIGFKAFLDGLSGHEIFPGELFADTSVAFEKAKAAGYRSFRYPDGKFTSSR